jgi:hypothetical protein
VQDIAETLNVSKTHEENHLKAAGVASKHDVWLLYLLFEKKLVDHVTTST